MVCASGLMGYPDTRKGRLRNSPSHRAFTAPQDQVNKWSDRSDYDEIATYKVGSGRSGKPPTVHVYLSRTGYVA